MSSFLELVGNVVRDPMRATTKTGKDVTRFDLAVNPPHAEGEEDGASYYNVSCYDSLARNVYETIHKGYRLIVSGHIEIRDVENEDGSTRRYVNVLANAVGLELRFQSYNPAAVAFRAEPGNERDDGDF